jgi:hypothetical protein
MSLVIIGKLYKISGDEENPTATELDGWHVNSTEPVAEWDNYQVSPEAPKMVFAGVETYHYRFKDKKEFDKLNKARLNDE